ncbi:MAG: ABC transporter ATP-binding protein [Candidatus Buchananbacteria bacterium]
MLKIKKLKKYFGGVHAVDDCSFEIEEGRITALIGPNGSGKTTIFNLISGIIKGDEGKIFLDKKNITNLNPDKISNLGLSRVFQQAHLFDNLSIEDNLSIAINNEDIKFIKNLLGLNFDGKEKNKRIKDVLGMIGINKSPKHICGELSYGQKRLVELARAILNPHKLLILDEPVAGVNPKLRDKIKAILKDLKKQGETIFLIEHDMNFTFTVADYVIVMDAGKVIAEGTPKQIKNNKLVLEAYLGE